MLASLLPDSGLSSWSMLRAIWEPHLWVFVSALLLTMILTPVVRALAIRWRVYDMPDERLKTHHRPIPYLGGVAIFIGWAVPVLVVASVFTFWPEANRLPNETVRLMKEAEGPYSLAKDELWIQASDPEQAMETPAPDSGRRLKDWPEEIQSEKLERRQTIAGILKQATKPESPWIDHPTKLFWIVGAAFVMLVLGLLDDLIDLKPKYKIIGQILAALALAAGGIYFAAFPYELPSDLCGGILFSPGLWWVVALGVAVQVVLVVGASNATNLLDGLDGLCSGVTAFICVGFLVLATSVLAWDVFRGTVVPLHYGNAGIVVVLSFALLGAVLGFLPYNFNPASIFMGDAGSMFLGFMAATFMVLLAERPEGFKWFLGSMVIFGLPIFDTGLALVRRLVNRQPIFAGDRSHFYDQLIDRGFSVQKSVSINYLLAMAFIVAGIGVVFLRIRYAVLIYLLVFAAVAVAAIKLGFIRGRASKA
jgi:UDP-GlcNAc:undecaprenyl-phosphate GlcNAc-1-phosphate transferase